MATIRHGPELNAEFLTVANDIARNPGITPTAKTVYLVLKSHREEWRIDKKQISDDTGVSVNTVAKALKELEDKGLIRREQLPGAQGKRGKFIYTIYAQPEPKNWVAGRPAETGQNPSTTPEPKNWVADSPAETPYSPSSTPEPNLPGTGEVGRLRKPSKNTKLENHGEFIGQPEVDPKIAAALGSYESVDEAFAAFWDEYPNHVKKKKARQLFEDSLEEVDAETIIQGVKDFNAERFYNEASEDWAPHPTTWLEDERWEDEHDLPRDDEFDLPPRLTSLSEYHPEQYQCPTCNGTRYIPGDKDEWGHQFAKPCPTCHTSAKPSWL